ncbi:hypothetical protein THTE_2310 [Thermogutta terrifontis]|uniref:Uncharacterized protein n=1 Tax=Thermogutta terrifontis TaxID=1331910 RepID=A0A286RG52_9BACT|nr:hypothetical protein THTE_2310 [Thermogutta terrifontis]
MGRLKLSRAIPGGDPVQSLRSLQAGQSLIFRFWRNVGCLTANPKTV